MDALSVWAVAFLETQTPVVVVLGAVLCVLSYAFYRAMSFALMTGIAVIRESTSALEAMRGQVADQALVTRDLAEEIVALRAEIRAARREISDG